MNKSGDRRVEMTPQSWLSACSQILEREREMCSCGGGGLQCAWVHVKTEPLMAINTGCLTLEIRRWLKQGNRAEAYRNSSCEKCTLSWKSCSPPHWPQVIYGKYASSLGLHCHLESCWSSCLCHYTESQELETKLEGIFLGTTSNTPTSEAEAQPWVDP